MKRSGIWAAMAALGAVAFALSPAAAQKAKDTLRIAVHQPISIVDAIFDPQPQTNLMDRVVFDTLVAYDSDNRKSVPSLAESWTQLDPQTVEFRLRRDVKFHDGQPFDADDVVYTVNFIIDPNVRFRFKETRFGKIDGVEKIDQYTVRIKTKEPHAPFLTRLITQIPILPSKAHARSPDKSQFGRAPIGTGPYKAVMVDSTKGVILERNPDFKHAGPGQQAAKISRIHIIPIPDEQTRVAQLMVGEIDLIYDVSRDVAEQLKSHPAIDVSVRPSISFVYLAVDVANRSGFNHFKDKRVREAMMRAIDRNALVKALQPAEIASMPLQMGMCHPWHNGCAVSTQPPSYDPDLARKLLAEAGLPKGFNVTVATWGPARFAAEAAAGQLRRVGINVALETLTVPAFVKKRAAGELPAYMVLWDNGGGVPDVDSTAGFFYEAGDQNYNGDPELTKIYEDAQKELDPAKREAMYRRMFDKVNEERYSMPIIPLSAVLAHSKDLIIPTSGTKKPEGFMFNLLAWK